MTYVFFSYDGAIFSVAKKLMDEGNRVLVCQIQNPDVLGVESWVNDSESAECKRRRLSLFDGILEKFTYAKMMSLLYAEKNKNNFFIFFDYNNMCKIAEKVLKMGYVNGLFPTTYDYKMEKDRKYAKNFVKQYYPEIKLKETKQFSSVGDTIKFIEESEKIWVVKSDGNFAETLVPDRDDLDMARKEVISELLENKKEFEKGKIIVEEKIINAIEFTPQLIFYNGKPIYSQIEIETRMLGCLDIGDQTGGNENLIIHTELSDPINKIVFPPIVYEEASTRKGLYIRDAGILSDGIDLYFTEFAGCRYGWGGIFSELSASMTTDLITDYFDKIVRGQDPYTYKYGTSLALYTLGYDHEFAGFPQSGIPVNIEDGYESDFFMYQVKKIKNRIITVGYRCFSSAPLGYVTGRGETIESAVENLYTHLKRFSLKGIYYRPESDFLSVENNKCILKRVEFLRENKLIS